MISIEIKKEGKLLYSSDKSGLRPLVIGLDQIKETDCDLFDKVIGLAAAKMIVDSKKIINIKTNLISEPAIKYLTDKLRFTYKEKCKNILNKDKTDICPMEKAALELDDKKFIEHINKIFKP